MAINSKIILCKDINLDKQYKNVLNYTETQMVTLCQSKAIASANNYSFVRTSPNRVYVDFDYNLCLQSNYIAFQNPRYSNKWFFGFIDEVIYKSDKSTEIRFTVDAWSTWYDYWTAQKCFINRQHVTDDTVGLHTIPEDIDCGDMICDNEVKYEGLEDPTGKYWVVVASNYNPAGSGTRFSGVTLFNNYIQGVTWFAFLIKPNDTPQNQGIDVLDNWIQSVDSKGHSADIQAMFIIPYNLIAENDVNSDHLITGNTAPYTDKQIFQKSLYRQFSDYTPRNGKLLVYPYSFMRVTNNMGSYNDYMIEDFDTDIEFSLTALACMGVSAKLRPVNYKGVLYNDDESLQLGKYPVLSWSSDSYTNWISQNSYNIGVGAANLHFGNMISTITTALNSPTQVSEMNFGGLVNQQLTQGLSYAQYFAKVIGDMRRAKMQPNTAQGNANSGDISFLLGNLQVKYMHIRPKKEYLEIIDSYFDRFGYKICKLETPNIAGRKYWNYIEIGAGEEIGKGEVPVNYMETINTACQKGITIWHNHDNIGNFSLLNTII